MGRDAGKCPAGVVRRRQVGQLTCFYPPQPQTRQYQIKRTGPDKRQLELVRRNVEVLRVSAILNPRHHVL